jgi:4-diphosphocytidyl-2-C-methyl-D-erythritol kinase
MFIKAFGKVNLYLDVLAKREDNYHEILTLFQSISNYDEIYLEFSEKEIFESEPELQISWNKNIIKKAIDTFKKETGIIDFNLKIKLIKNLPIGGGIGGGSADAAAVLNFLSQHFNVSEVDLFEIAQKIGSDVPFLLKGGTAIGRGKGEILEFLPRLKLNIELFTMGVSIDTKKMYRKIDKNWGYLVHQGDPYKLYNALKNKDIFMIKKNAFNIFEQVVFDEYPQIKQKKEILEKDGKTIIAMMSGSGSTIFRVY